jgi:hypothetical protein
MTFRYKTELACSTAEHLAFFRDAICNEGGFTLLEKRSAMIEVEAQAMVWVILENPSESANHLADELMGRYNERLEELGIAFSDKTAA